MTSETDGSVAPDPVQRLEGWMRERFGPDIAVQGPAETNTEGFDSEIHFLSLVGADVPEGWRGPLVLRIKPSAELSVLARRERDVQNWCADAGLPVPRVLQVLEPGDPYDRPAQVMERAPGTMLLNVLRSSPSSAGPPKDWATTGSGGDSTRWRP